MAANVQMRTNVDKSAQRGKNAPGFTPCYQGPACALALAAHRPAHQDGTPAPEPPSFLAAISKAIGRKQFCHELRVSKSLLDQWMSGEKRDPIERVRDIMRIARRCYGPDLPLDIAQELVAEFGGLVVMERKRGEQ